METAATKSRTIELLEGFSKPTAIDRENGVVKGVRILGLVSQNGREYLREAASGARDLYEGSKVRINHAKGSESRDYRDQFGHLRNVIVEADGGLRGDLHFNPKHALAEQFCWDAEHSPGSFGLSHNVMGRTTQRNGKTVVEAITKVISVDLVADPATTKSLFESRNDMDLQEQIDALKADVVKLSGDLKAKSDEAAALKEQLAAKDKEAAEAKRKEGIAAAFATHKVERSSVPAGLLTIIESSTVEAAAEAIKGLAEHKGSTVKSVAGGGGSSKTEQTDAKSFIASITR